MIALNKKTTFMQTLQKHFLSFAALVAILLSVTYWSLIASDRYISEAHIIIQSTDMDSGQTTASGVSGLLGKSGLGNAIDQLLLRDYLLSIDMLKKLDAKLNLRAHYSDPRHDFLSRMSSPEVELEEFYDYFLERTSIEMDDYAGILVIKTQAFEPSMAHAITASLVEDGERFMNDMGHNLAQAQVDFLKTEIAQIQENSIKARQELIAFQNKNGMVSPQGTSENLASIINSLEAQLTKLQASRAAMLGYLMPDSANISELNLQISATEKQIAKEKERLASPTGKTLNSIVEAYQRLEMNAEFAQDIYKAALVSLEKGRVEASRTLKKVSVLQAPTLPEYSLEPRRLYNCTVNTLVILLTAGILQLLAAIIRDHQD
jgi:capsular polysaccharide transport system permease protein